MTLKSLRRMSIAWRSFALSGMLLCVSAETRAEAVSPSTPSPDASYVVSAINQMGSAMGGITSGINRIIQQLVEMAQFQLKVEETHASAKASLLFEASPDPAWANKFYQWVGQSMFVNQKQTELLAMVSDQATGSYAEVMSDKDTAAFPTIATGSRSEAATKRLAEVLPLNEDAVKEKIKAYNVETIIGQDVFRDDEALKQATNFINALSLVGTNFQQGANEKNFKAYLEKNNARGLQYMAVLANYAAGTSVGLSALYDMAAKRYPQQKIKDMKLTNVKGDSIESVAQLERHMAERRALSPEWYATMAAATPATVERETLFLLAELRLQAYRNQQQQERILATLAAIHLATMQTVGNTMLTMQQSATQGAGTTLRGTPGA